MPEKPWSRIDDLLSDLGGQLDAAEAAELAAEVEDRGRRESALLTLADRLRGSVGRPLAVRTSGGTARGRLDAVGRDWCALRDGDGVPGRHLLVPLAAVLIAEGVGPGAFPGSHAGLDGRLDLRHRLRAVARDRQRVRLSLVDGSEHAGLLDRVGADHLDLVEHGEADRRRAPLVRLVPLAALALVRY